MYYLILLMTLLASACGTPDPAVLGEIEPEALLAAPPAQMRVLDVRTQAEFAAGHVPGAIHIPHDELAARLEELGAAQDEPVVVYCERGGRAGRAAEVLLEAGYRDVRHLVGDMRAWREAGRPIETP